VEAASVLLGAAAEVDSEGEQLATVEGVHGLFSLFDLSPTSALSVHSEATAQPQKTQAFVLTWDDEDEEEEEEEEEST
jgi:hypothetical protein